MLIKHEAWFSLAQGLEKPECTGNRLLLLAQDYAESGGEANKNLHTRSLQIPSIWSQLLRETKLKERYKYRDCSLMVAFYLFMNAIE